MIETLPVTQWDDDGYPTEASLAALAAPLASEDRVWSDIGAWLRRELAACADHCCASYREEAYVERGKPYLRLHFSTGGWSGAEDLVEALLAHIEIGYFHVQWNRGGHYIFEISAAIA